MTASLISAFITLLVVVDPIGLGPIFIGLTQGIDAPTRRKIGLQASVIAFCVLAGTALVGDWLLRGLGISLAAFRIAGGLLLFAIAFEMVFGHRVERKATLAGGPNDALSIAAFPLAIPLMAGPGAITAMVLLAGRVNGDMLGLVLVIGIMGIMMAACFAVFLASERLERLLGIQGEMVLGRLLGVLLAALAVQYVADGILALSQH
jgi:multiple antibiotic resistance protein